MLGSFEHGNETTGSIKGGDLLSPVSHVPLGKVWRPELF
jgi:hypothetical protein